MIKRRIRFIDIVTFLGLVLTATFIIYGIRMKIFVSPEALRGFLDKFGMFADLAFIIVQAVQVIVPIIPGALGCLVGVIIFGPLKGFVYNYLGICIGSIIVFYLSRHYGIKLIDKISNPKLMLKYRSWLSSDKFDKWFALAIFFPVAPDDFLCYLAGITGISAKKFCMIILTCKPFAIAAYSIGLNLIFTTMIHYILPMVSK